MPRRDNRARLQSPEPLRRPNPDRVTPAAPSAALSGTIDPASPTPLYHQIFALLRERIYDGHFPGGSFLPSEQELSDTFDVSRITAKRALDELAADGLAVREQGRGTRVCVNPHSTSVRGSVRGLVHSLHANGRSTVELVDFGYVHATADIAARLGLKAGDEVQRATRIWQGADGPFSHLTTFVPGRLGHSWTKKDLMKRPLISLLEGAGVTLGRAEGAGGRRRGPPARSRSGCAAVDDHAHGIRQQRPAGRAPRRVASARSLSVFGLAGALIRWRVVAPKRPARSHVAVREKK
jgi:GntR family transcriptional regulator